jgi:hypothetical protein
MSLILLQASFANGLANHQVKDYKSDRTSAVKNVDIID